MRMEVAQEKPRSGGCALFFHTWFVTKCHEVKYEMIPEAFAFVPEKHIVWE